LPTKEKNTLQIWDEEKQNLKEISKADGIIDGISSIALNHQGILLSVSSLDGTIVRFFKVEDIEAISIVKEFKRGRHPVNVFNLDFNFGSEFLAMSTDSNTLHVFPVPRVLRHKGNLAESEYQENSESPESLGKSYIGAGNFFYKMLGGTEGSYQ